MEANRANGKGRFLMVRRSRSAIRTAALLTAAALTFTVGAGTAGADDYWAHVAADGSLIAGKGVVSSNRGTTGTYSILFNINLVGVNGRQRCVPMATLDAGNADTGQVEASTPALAFRSAVTVLTSSSLGIAADRAFFVAVIC
jgi:hypothetical protein